MRFKAVLNRKSINVFEQHLYIKPALSCAYVLERQHMRKEARKGE
jgi:hypothetical protein